LFQTAAGEIWLIDDSGNFAPNCFDGRRWSEMRLSRQFGGDDIYSSILQTRDGVLWVSGFGQLFAQANDRWRCYRSGELPVTKDRLYLLETSQGDLWIAGRDSETWRLEYSGRRWRTYEGLHFQDETPDGRHWFVSCEGHVVVEDPKDNRWLEYGSEDGCVDGATGLLVTRRGEVWAGGSNGGVPATAWFDGNSWHRKEHPELSYAVGYRSMFESADGSLWFACEPGPWRPDARVGLLRCRRGEGVREEWTQFGSDQGVDSIRVGIGQTADGLLYLGGLTLAQFDGKQSIQPPMPQELENRWIDDVYSTPDGQLWLTVGGLGVYCRNGTNWTKYTTKDGLANNMVSTLRRLQDGTILAGNAKGISRFDGRSWTPCALPAALRIDRESGTLRQSADKAIWVNTTDRAWYRRSFAKPSLAAGESLSFRTTRYQPQAKAPATHFLVFPQVVSQPGNAYFSWAAVDPWNMTPTEKLEYSFRLNDEEWSPFSSGNSHYYLKMKRGKYRLQVRARDGDFNVETPPAEVVFSVLPPAWQQGWFLALLAGGIIVVGILEGALIKRDRKIRAGNLELSKLNHSLKVEIQEHRRSQLQLEERTRLLEDEVEERKRLEAEKDRIHKELLTASRRAGMADVATNVLHNVGNVLNSANVSVGLIAGWARATKKSAIRKVSNLMRQQGENLGRFMTQDDRGKQIPAYLEQLADRLDQERRQMLEEIDGLSRNIDHIKGIVALQQNYARIAGVLEEVPLSDLVEDALRFHRGAFVRHDVKIIREFAPIPPMTVDRHKVLQILVNLLSNAKQACDAGSLPEKRITVRIAAAGDDRVKIEVADNGIGIAPENLTRIFSQGFTTRKNGHGFGLHSSALTAAGIGGALRVHSDGLGKGANFTLELSRTGG
jgi:signal transduction histidine kinase